MELELVVWVLLTIPPAGRGGWQGKEEKNERNYARFWLCKNSRRLREASMVKTVSRERNKNNAKYVSMHVSYNEAFMTHLITS